jgi:hypothetical protein
VFCACGSATDTWLGDDSDSVCGFGGQIGAGLGRLEEPLEAMRDLLEDFIESMYEEESKGVMPRRITAEF